ncbi:CLUMA_CG009280, isoform C [Clunio marinus]|uniref:Protein phosphatase 1 regulatory subunit 12B n=1 Tax=Clunio marinus TaxID=568069 RepID=A0A1J1I7X0_9DIPT|nr:CLUMA_CG009280, isoform C [Clunio marinus]
MALNKTAFSKRAEQLKRYEDSETNRESVLPKNSSARKVRFSAGCIFLAACAAGDKDEVLNMLNSGGADIDTANVDGLTALHQACIEDNLDMVEFLVSHGADINRKDNEGWTPLHATSSCGIVSIARYLIENGADLAAVNSDGELPIDIAGTKGMADLLQRYIDDQGIDCEEARTQEEKQMLADAKKWLRSDASEADRPHPKTGATALHVAAAKGYTKVLSLLLAGRADVDRQDNDGWTPLHAACYWGKKEAAQMLIASMADMDIQNYSNQTAIDIAPSDMTPWLEELKKNNKRTKRRPISQIRISDNLDNNIESPPKVIRVEVKSPAENANAESESEESEEGSESDESEESESEEIDEQQTNKVSSARDQMQLPLTNDNDSSEDKSRLNVTSKEQNTPQESPPKIQVPDKENQTNDSEVILRRTQSFENDQKYIELRARIKANSCPALPATPVGNNVGVEGDKDAAVKPTTNFIIQRSASLKDHRHQLSKKSNEKTPPTSPSTPASTPGHMRSLEKPTAKQESAVGALATANQNIIDLIARRYSSPSDTLKNVMTNSSVIANARKHTSAEVAAPSTEKIEESKSQPQPQSPTSPSTPTTMLNKLSPGNIFKNFFKSFVPPTRDEESETQRKAHAKRVRETRRSTQGVTLDEIKSAEQLVKMKNANNNNGNTENSSELNERLTESESAATVVESEDSSSNEVAVNYTISSPLRKTNRASVDKDEDENDDEKISATFTISPPPKSNTNAINLLTTRLEKGLELDDHEAGENSVTATINVPLIPNRNTTTTFDVSDKLKKTEEDESSSPTYQKLPPIPQPRSLFDIDNSSSLKLADKLQEEAKKCDANMINDDSNSDSVEVSEPLPPSPIHHTIFGERKPSWRFRNEYSSSSSKFKNEESTSGNSSSQQQPPTSPTNGTTDSPHISTNSLSASTEKESPVTINRSDDDKENEKENDNRTGQATQAVIQRRRRPKRRSTGVDIDADRQESPVDNGDDKELTKIYCVLENC